MIPPSDDLTGALATGTGKPSGGRVVSLPLKRFFLSEVGAVVAWVLGSLFLAALISPWFYHAGKALASAAAVNDWPTVVEWLAAACGRAKLGRFFDRSLLFSALVLLPFLLRRIRRLRVRDVRVSLHPLARLGWKTTFIQLFWGCLIASTLLWCMVLILDSAGAYQPRESLPATGKLLRKTLIPALSAPLVEEWLFRGLLLGLWLRFAKPAAACFGSSLVFAFVHFLQPPAGTVIADPYHPLAGFQLLGQILLHLADPRFFVTDFATLLLVGLILSWARLRTGALWFSMGLHAGWVAAFKASNLLRESVPSHPLYPWGIGESLLSGLLPILMLLVTAWVCRFALGNTRINPSSP
jgi:uncharacterized protein